jgi:N-acetylglucosamine kinase-like BadF-type ATPase
MAFFFGFDAGGTKTTCALGDETQLIARAVGGSIKPLRVSFEEARHNMRALLEEIATKSGVDPHTVAASCIGTAGFRLPQTDGWMREILSPHAGGSITVCGDEEIALDAAFPGQPGVLIIAGTGSNTLGRTSTGELLNVGGWGPALGDQGSGHWIGHQALRHAFHALDFGQPTTILDRVARFWSAPSLGEVVNIANGMPPPDFSKLAPLIVECAEQGDAVALELLREAGRLLGEDAVQAWRRVKQADPSAEIRGIAFVGSVLDKIARVRQSMMDTVHSHLPEAMILPTAVDAIQGALWRARQSVSS